MEHERRSDPGAQARLAEGQERARRRAHQRVVDHARREGGQRPQLRRQREDDVKVPESSMRRRRAWMQVSWASA
jgi:hypothetical protein